MYLGTLKEGLWLAEEAGAGFAGDDLVVFDGEAGEELAAVGFGEDAGIEDGDDAAVGFFADEAADALAEFD